MCAQFARPTADSVDGSWTDQAGGTSLFAAIDETTASDADYIRSSPNPSSDLVKIKLGSVSDPGSSSGHIVRYRIGKIGSAQVDVTARLRQGTTLIAEWTHTDIATGPTDVSQTLSGAQADAITDYTDLYIEIVASTGLTFLIRDQFSDADIDPLVDSPAVPGPGTRKITGTDIRIEDGALQGIQQASSPVWGNSKATYDGLTRANGLTAWLLVIPSDRNAELGIGWATTEAVTNPKTDGHHWIMDEGFPRVGTPGKDLLLSGTGVGTFGAMRAAEYLVGVTLRDTGAFYWTAAAGPHTDYPANSDDHIGVPTSPQARVWWVDDTATTTPMYPHITGLTPIAGGHWADDLRVAVIPEWASATGMAAFYDPVDRANSTTSPGGGWTEALGDWGVVSNKIYVVTHNGSTYNYITHPTSLPDGDGIFKAKVTWPTNTSDEMAFWPRFIDINNFFMMTNGGFPDRISFYTRVAGTFNLLGNYPVTWVAGQEYEYCVIAKGSNYQMYLDGNLLFDWTDDATGGTFNGATTMGVATYPLASGGRWRNVMAQPNIITLPSSLLVGDLPHIFTAGSTIASDNFTAANGTALSGRTTDTGALTWGVLGTGWQINSNRAGNTNINGSGDDYFAFVDTGTTDVHWQASVVLPSGGDTVRTGALLRYTDVNNFIYVRMWEGVEQATNNEIEVLEVSGGVAYSIHKMQFGDLFTLTGESYTLTCPIKGDLLHVFLNGDLAISYHIRYVLTGTKHGFYHASVDDGTSFDSIVLKALS